MKKILIWDYNIPLENKGGPSGYLYNIYKYLETNPSTDIVFLSDLLPANCNSLFQKRVGLGKKILKCCFPDFLFNYLRWIWGFYITVNIPDFFDYVDLSDFHYIHFHKLTDSYSYRKYIRRFSGKTILISHDPEPRVDEKMRAFGIKVHFFSKIVRGYLLRREVLLFSRFDFFMFPCFDARECYEKEKLYKELFVRRNDDFYYVPTAILELDFERKYDNFFFRKYGIPDDAFVISYIGRHSEIKGYDFLKNIALKVFENNPNIFFVVGGKEEPLKGINHSQWIELGWINNADEIIFQSDFFILPNRETYFDIVLLEVLRAGVPVLMTLTGGNKYFYALSKEKREGLFFYSNNALDSAVSIIERLYKTKKDRGLLSMRQANKQLWKQEFSLERYIIEYVSKTFKL